ncbi:hypothetical protein MOQ72_43635 [Saccharopolyspora sp. K220]|uniref:hypothetical protein n=1 Tax=Saccharopolyspora soli TaxID=2926618 RepID=UPI001F581BF2|nr:hypothetical protein [Saccharopolyspora soli]MCI2424307.1 hypothetical protein [Saccharopolyspora soli]
MIPDDTSELRARIREDREIRDALSPAHPDRDVIQARIDLFGSRLTAMERAAEQQAARDARARRLKFALFLTAAGALVTYGTWNTGWGVVFGIAMAIAGVAMFARRMA